MAFWNLPWSKRARLSNAQNHFWNELNNCEKYPGRQPYGQVKYINGVIIEDSSIEFIKAGYDFFVENGGMYCEY